MGRFHFFIALGGGLALYGLAFAVPGHTASAGSVSFPVYIPEECVVLAQREGVPTVIENRYQAVKARVKLARLSSNEPMVEECRAAVKRAEIAVKAIAKAEKESAKLEQATKEPGKFEQASATH
jgi:hypothetical protein